MNFVYQRPRLTFSHALLLALALGAARDARAATTVLYDAPAAIAAAGFQAGPGQPPVSVININGSPPDSNSEPRSAVATAGGGSGYAIVSTGERGIVATASAGGSASGSSAAYDEFEVIDPQNRTAVKLQLIFKAISGVAYPGMAGWQIVVGEASESDAEIVYDDNGKVTSYGAPGYTGSALYIAQGRVRGLSAGGTQADKVVLINDQVVSQDTSSSSTVQLNGADTFYSSGNTVLLVKFAADANGIVRGSGVTLVDPVIVPHPDNPDVFVVAHAAPAPPTEPPLGGITPETIQALGIDPQPFIDLGFFDPAPPEVEAPCTNGTPVTSASLIISTAARTGHSKLHFRGQLALAPLPLDPPFDPVAHGARARVEDASGAVVIDETVPGGTYDRATKTGWHHKAARKTWVYTRPTAQGIFHLVLGRVAHSNEVYRFGVDANLGATSLPGQAALPLKGTFVVDAPIAHNGQCGEAQFGGGSPTDCSFGRGPRLVCK